MRDQLDAALGDRYTIVHELGRGAMGTVWLARDLRHDRFVAIKVLQAEFAGATGAERFLREVRTTARLQHPCIVPVLDSGVLAGRDDGRVPWFAMPYLEGETLRERLAREQLFPIDEAVWIGSCVADALHSAHRQGVVHRDIKPENILLVDGSVYVVDFGIAKAMLEFGGDTLTSAGLAIGTPAYMSPEQASAGAVDARSDQYSLATVIYEMLAGEPPFAGSNASVVIARRFAEPARPIRSVRPAVPAALERTVLRALERVPADRYPDLAAFAGALRDTSAATRTVHVSVSPFAKGRRVAVIAAVIAGVLVAAMLMWPERNDVTRERDPALLALYQRGMIGYERRTPAGIVDAVTAFTAALRRDSTYTEAWTGLARTYVRAYTRHYPISGVPRDSMLQLAVAAVDAALASDRRSADAWFTHSLISRIVDPTDHGVALRSVRRALQLDSSNAEGWHELAVTLAEQGDLDGALKAWRRGIEGNALYTQGLAFMALGHYWRRQYDSAALWSDSVVAVDPTYVLGRNTAGQVAFARGEWSRALAAFEATRRLTTGVDAVNALAGIVMVEAASGHRRKASVVLRQADSLARAFTPVPHHTALYFSQAHAAMGNLDEAFEWLARYEPRLDLHFQLHLRCDPPFDPIRAEPRFREFLIIPATAVGRGC